VEKSQRLLVKGLFSFENNKGEEELGKTHKTLIKLLIRSGIDFSDPNKKGGGGRRGGGGARSIRYDGSLRTLSRSQKSKTWIKEFSFSAGGRGRIKSEFHNSFQWDSQTSDTRVSCIYWAKKWETEARRRWVVGGRKSGGMIDRRVAWRDLRSRCLSWTAREGRRGKNRLSPRLKKEAKLETTGRRFPGCRRTRKEGE